MIEYFRLPCLLFGRLEVPPGDSPEHLCAPDSFHLLWLAPSPSWPSEQPQRTRASPGPFYAVAFLQ